ncbi:MAG: hypothetical protein U0804_28685 [Gemmataceae bacterium]
MRLLTRRGFLAAAFLCLTATVASALTPAQQATLTADLAANTSQVGGVQVKDVEKTADNAVLVAAWYNTATSPTYLVWRTEVPVADILDQVNWGNYTPNDAPPAATNTTQGTNDGLLYNNRALLVQIKQTNLVTMLSGRNTFNAAKPTLRGGLNDATINLPTGTNGASRSGGWANIVTVLRRGCTNGERLYVSPSTGVGNDGVAGNRGSTTNPDLLGYEGKITDADVRASWGI